MVLNSIGVTGEPVDPGTPFEKLGDIDPAFLSGSIQPMTLRTMATTLINALPAAERAALGAIFTTSGDLGNGVLVASDFSELVSSAE